MKCQAQGGTSSCCLTDELPSASIGLGTQGDTDSMCSRPRVAWDDLQRGHLPLT